MFLHIRGGGSLTVLLFFLMLVGTCCFILSASLCVQYVKRMLPLFPTVVKFCSTNRQFTYLFSQQLLLAFMAYFLGFILYCKNALNAMSIMKLEQECKSHLFISFCKSILKLFFLGCSIRGVNTSVEKGSKFFVCIMKATDWLVFVS